MPSPAAPAPARPGASPALGSVTDIFARSRATTYVEIAESRGVAERAIDELGLDDSPAALVGRVDVSQPVDTALLRISARADSPQEAQQLADAWANAVAAEVAATEDPDDRQRAGTPYIDESQPREKINQEQLKHDPITLDAKQRPIVRDTIQEVCKYRGWSMLACNVRSNHVHVVVAADATPEKMMNDFKAYATRRLNEAELHRQGDKTWTRHGSTRYLNDEESLAGAIDYVLNRQGGDLGGMASADPKGPLPHGRGSLCKKHTPLLRVGHAGGAGWWVSRSGPSRTQARLVEPILLALIYPSRDRTDWAVELAMARVEVPACWRICARKSTCCG